jgi:hypothetical protein
MLDAARKEHGATHIAMIDADEILTANLIAGIRDQASCVAPGDMLTVPLYNLRGSLDRYHANGIWGNRWGSLVFRDTPDAHWAGEQFHHREPAGVKWKPWKPWGGHEQGGILHLWGVSEQRLIAKHALYKVTERLRFPAKPVREIERMYNLWRSKNDEVISYPNQWPDEWKYADVPPAWWKHKVRNAGWSLFETPWQEAEVRRLVAEHGRETFQGLDLFGVVD